tara:strand:- start:3 stop:662 length:660 start_codon:yes stop_codon:yes gene_type:complete
MKQKVIMIGIASGLVQGPLGYTHCCIEDIAILRSLPNITILSPCDSLETVKSIDAALKNDQSTYIRITGGVNNPIVYDEDYKFNIGEAVTLREGKEIAIIATGTMVYESLEASKVLNESGINPTVINIHTIKPIDKNKIVEIIKTHKVIFTVEEHNIIGGLSSAVSEIIASNNVKCLQIPIGINDIYDKGGPYAFLKKKHGLIKDNIISKVKEATLKKI